MAIRKQVEVLPPHLEEDLALGIELEGLFERFLDLVVVIVLVIVRTRIIVTVVVLVLFVGSSECLP